MRSTKIIRAAKTGYIILSAIFCGLGILLMTDPRLSVALIGDIVGIVLVAFGIIKLIGYFSKDLYRLAFQFDLAFGILLIALGLALLIKPESAMNILCMILGIEIIADGLFKIQTSLDAKRFGLNTWWLMLSLAMGYSTPATLKKVYQHTMDGKRAEVNGAINSHMDKLFSGDDPA